MTPVEPEYKAVSEALHKAKLLHRLDPANHERPAAVLFSPEAARLFIRSVTDLTNQWGFSTAPLKNAQPRTFIGARLYIRLRQTEPALICYDAGALADISRSLRDMP